MQSSTYSKDTFHEGIRFQAGFVFDNPHEISTSNDIFCPHSNTGNSPIEGFVFFFRKLFPLLFLDSLYNRCLFRSISLLSGTLVQRIGNREIIHCISHLLILSCTGNCLADKKDQIGHCNYNGILYCTTLLFQIYMNKEKPVRDIRQRVIFIYVEATTVISVLTIQFLVTQIIIMGCPKIGKQMKKLNMNQGRETLGIIFMLVIIHAIKLQAYTMIYNKFKLH